MAADNGLQDDHPELAVERDDEGKSTWSDGIEDARLNAILGAREQASQRCFAAPRSGCCAGFRLHAAAAVMIARLAAQNPSARRSLRRIGLGVATGPRRALGHERPMPAVLRPSEIRRLRVTRRNSPRRRAARSASAGHSVKDRKISTSAAPSVNPSFSRRRR